MALYSLVAWPPAALADWLSRQQAMLGVAAYGAPHLNIRTPFEWAGDVEDLRVRMAQVLRGLATFEVCLQGWQRFPHTIFLALTLDRTLEAAHARVLALPDVPAGPRDGGEYLPHLTLALGLLDWAEDRVWQAVQALEPPPVSGWQVNELALTLDSQGGLTEMARFDLSVANR